MSVLRRGWKWGLCLGRNERISRGKGGGSPGGTELIWHHPRGAQGRESGAQRWLQERRNLVRKGGCNRVTKKALTRIVFQKGKVMGEEDGSSTRCLGKQ